MPTDFALKLQKYFLISSQVIIGIFLLINLVGCKTTSTLPTSVNLPSLPNTATPTNQVASTHSAKPTLTVTSSLTLAKNITPSPESKPSPQINPLNAASLIPLVKLGRGMLNAAPFYSADGQLLVIPTTIGVDLYDSASLQKLTSISSMMDEDSTLMPAYPRLVALSPDSQFLAANLYTIVFSPDGKVDVTSIGKTAIFVWNVADSSLVQKITLAPEDSIANLAFSPDSQSLAAGFNSGKAQFWSIADGSNLFSLKGSLLDFSPDGSLLATMPSFYAEDHQIYVYNTTSGVLLQQWDGQRALFSAEGLLAVENQGAVRIMDIEKGIALQAFNGESAAFSDDGQSLALLDQGTIKLYSVIDGHLLHTMEGDFESIFKMQFSPNGQTLAAVGEMPMCPNCLTIPKVALWQTSNGKIVPLDVQDPLWLTFDPQAGYLVVWSVDAVRFLNPEDVSTITEFAEYANSVDGIAFSPDGQLLAANSGLPNLTTRIWQVEHNQLIQILEDHSNPGYGTSKLAFSPDGQILFAQGNFRSAKDGKQLTTLIDLLRKEAPPYFPASVAFSPDGKTMAIGYLEGHLQLWNLNEKKLICRLEGYNGEVVSLAFSTDGKTLAAVFAYPDYTIQLWQVPLGERLLNIQGKEWTYEFSQAILSPDGETLATLAKNEEGIDMGIVELWRVSDGQRLLQLDTSGIMDAAFSPDGKIIATGSYDHTVRLWQAEDGKPLAIFRGHGDSITDLTFSPSGDILASSSNDGTVILWGLPNKP